MANNLTEIYVDSTSNDSNNEIFQINDIKLSVLPSDIVAFSDNAVYEESFIRSKAVFAFRSKYSRGKIIVTLPISLNAFADFESGSKDSQEDGLNVLYQLSTRPFCFIKSQRVRSYLSSRAKISSTGFMMFAVDEINTVHDLRVPDVLFAEIHLVFCDHTSQAADFKFMHLVSTTGVDDPALSLPFTESYNAGYAELRDSLLSIIRGPRELSGNGVSDVYRSDPTTLGSVVLLGPSVHNSTELDDDNAEADLKQIKEMGYYKEVVVTSPHGQDSLSDNFFRGSNSPDEDSRKELDMDTQHFHIYWTNFHDLSFGGASSVKSIKISRKNKLATLFIGTHKYPFVQYMGKYPARIEIAMDFNSADIYNQNESSVVAAVGQLGNVLDYNNEIYPEISAYNVLKIQSIASMILGVENLVPNQTFISASSSNQGMESVNINFIEADIEEFMKVGTKFEGRPSYLMDNVNNTELSAVIKYLKAIQADPAARTAIEESADRDIHADITSALRGTIKAAANEVTGIARTSDKILADTETSNKVLADLKAKFELDTKLATEAKYEGEPNATPAEIEATRAAKIASIKAAYDTATQKVAAGMKGNDYVKDLNAAKDSDYEWPDTSFFGADATYDDAITSQYINILETRLKVQNTAKDNRQLKDEEKASSGLSYVVNDPKTGTTVTVDASEVIGKQGIADVNIKNAYQSLLSLKEKGDALATSVLASTQVADEYLLDRIHSYVGTNLADLEQPYLKDPGFDPFHFLNITPYFDSDQLMATYTTLSKDIAPKLEGILTAKLKESDSEWFGNSGYFSLFSESGISVEEMYVLEESEEDVAYDNFGEPIDLTSFVAGGSKGSGFKGLNTANATKYDEMFLQSAAKHGVDAGLLKAIAHAESGFNPNARSPVGAMGLMQFMPATAKGFGLTNPYDPATSIDAAAKYLKTLSKYSWIKGDVKLMLAGYNAGEGNVQKYGGIPPFKETREYVPRVLNFYNTLYKSGLQGDPKNSSYEASKATPSAEQNKANIAHAAAATANGTNTANTATGVDMNKFQKVTVLSVTDGDTLNVSVNGKIQPIRIRGLDTPETEKDRKIKLDNGKLVELTFKGQSYGANSTKALNTMIANEKQTIFIEKNLNPDPNYPSRMISTVYLPSNKANVAEEMIKSGNATMYTRDTAGGIAIEALKKYELTAKQTGLGLWGKGFLDSQSVALFKQKKDRSEEFEAKLKKVTSEKQFEALLKEYSDVYSPNGKVTYDGKQIKAATPAKVTSTPAELGTSPLGSTNTDIHVQGAVVADVRSQWGLRNYNGTKNKDGSITPTFHAGIDSTGNKRKEILAAADGYVTHAGLLGKAGIVAIVDHGNGFQTKYFHLKEYSGKPRQVKTGEQIGVMGNTGTKDVHLHQETFISPLGSSSSLNVNPWKTTSLKLLSSLDPKEVHRNVTSYLDKTHLLSAHPDHAGQNVLKHHRGKQLVFGGDGLGAGGNSSTDDPTVVTTSSSGVSQADGQSGEAYIRKPASRIAKRNIDASVSVYNELGAAKIQMETMSYLQKYHMNIAYPAVKVYVVVGSESEDAKVLKTMMPNYYFEVDGVKDFALVCNNDDNPVDFMSFRIANASFIRTDNAAIAGKFLARDLSNIGTSEEVSFVSDRVRLKPGTKLHIRAGYGNDPNNLKTIFNGVVVELGNEDGISLSVIAEGYGRELLMDAISPHKPTTPGNFFTNNSTPLIISSALGNREGIANFGNKVNFWSTVAAAATSLPGGFDHKAHDYSDPETKRLTTLYADTSFRPGNYRQRLFTNIYAAEIESLHSNYNSTWKNRIFNLFSLTEQSGYYYIMHGQTPWAVLKEMEYRHPGTLMKPLFYQDRMTMFFGLKEQMYIARDLDPSFMSKIATRDDTTINQEYMKNRPLRMDTVLGFHIISSELNIIQNNISINSQFKTGANVIYFEDKEDIVEKQENDDLKEFKMKMDDNLAQWEHRYLTLEMPGIHGKYSAFMYGTTALRREAEKMYGGSIVLVGNPCIKAGDYAYISDNLRRFNGMIKIRECKHYMDENRGFVTEITPGLYVEASSFIYSALFSKLSFTARTAIATASLSQQIISNDEADFAQYMTYFDELKNFVKPKRGWGWGASVDWAKTAWNETGIIAPVVGMGISALSIMAMYRIGLNLSRAAVAKTAAKGIITATELRAIGSMITSGVKDLSWLRSATTLDILKSAGTSLKSIRGAGIMGGAGHMLAASGKVLGAGGWWSATRALKAITTIGTVLLGSNPIGWMIRIAGQLALSFVFAKVQEEELTRQPLMIFPILANGRPYQGGMNGYNYNTYWDSVRENFNKNWREVSKAGYVMETTSNSTMMSAVGSMLADSNAFGLAEKSYRDEEIAKMQKVLSYKGAKIQGGD